MQKYHEYMVIESNKRLHASIKILCIQKVVRMILKRFFKHNYAMKCYVMNEYGKISIIIVRNESARTLSMTKSYRGLDGRTVHVAHLTPLKLVKASFKMRTWTLRKF